MFVNPLRLKAQGAALSTVALLTLGACEDPTATTDLRPEGGPEILTVTVMNDPGNFVETATFCKVGDAKRPGFVGVPVAQICDDDLTVGAGFRDPSMLDANGEPTFVPAKVEDAIPTSWYVRVMFDELLNPDVEDLIEITEDGDNDPATPDTGTGEFIGTLVNTQPVVLSCTAPGSTTPTNIEYDGYYSPAGNRVTWPLGPSLFIQPVDLSTVATGSTCTVAMTGPTLVDKDNLAPPDASNPDYSWGISSLEFIESDPAPAAPGDESVISPDSTLVLVFNAFIDPATLAAAEVTIEEHDTLDCMDPTPTARTAAISGDPASGIIEIGITGAPTDLVWNAEKSYLITFSADNAVADLAGGPGAVASDPICFVTDVAP